MISSRNLNELLPPVKLKVERFLGLCVVANIDILITSTYRDNEAQDALYAQGRTAPGKIVTKAVGGNSFHNYRCAVDVVPLVNGKPDWNGDHPVWKQVGELGKQAGLDWAGEWKEFHETCHFQYTGGLTLEQLKAGAQVK